MLDLHRGTADVVQDKSTAANVSKRQSACIQIPRRSRETRRDVPFMVYNAHARLVRVVICTGQAWILHEARCHGKYGTHERHERRIGPDEVSIVLVVHEVSIPADEVRFVEHGHQEVEPCKVRVDLTPSSVSTHPRQTRMEGTETTHEFIRKVPLGILDFFRLRERPDLAKEHARWEVQLIHAWAGRERVLLHGRYTVQRGRRRLAESLNQRHGR